MRKISRVAHLELELMRTRAQDISATAGAHRALARLGKDRYMASGVIVSIKNLGGQTLVDPVMIADGLSQETIDALRRDVRASHEYRIAMNRIEESGE